MDNDVLNNEGRMQVLTVYIGDRVFGIPIALVQDVLSALDLTHVPMSDSHIQGVMNLRGRIVTAINLYGRMQKEGDDTPLAQLGGADKKPMNVVVEDNHELYSLLVDKVGDVLNLKQENIEPPPMTLEESWRKISRGVYQLDKTIMVILDMKKIIHIEKPHGEKLAV